MYLQKNNWLIFLILFSCSFIYLGYSIYDRWHQILQDTSAEMSFLNRILSSSITTTFDQQEIMLELIGKQLINNRLYQHPRDSARFLDNVLSRNDSLIAFGLANTDGLIIAGSSNLDLSKKPNLKTNEKSRDTFLQALASRKMLIGSTYFFKNLDSWVIPIRKSIHDQDNQLQGVMTSGIRPDGLFSRLEAVGKQQQPYKYQSMLLHDVSFSYVYISSVYDHETLQKVMQMGIPTQLLEQHKSAIRERSDMDLDDLKTSLDSVEYFAPNMFAEIKFYSLLYLPKHKLWSVIYIPRIQMLEQLLYSSLAYFLTFTFSFIIIFFLFLYIDKEEKKTRQRLIQQANHDFLTGLNNRQYLSEVENQWIHPNADAFSIFFIDLDNFKNINDSYGHSFGDSILKQVSGRLRQSVEKHELVCRQGGDEFVILSQYTDQEKLEILATSLVSELSKPYNVDPFQFSIGASVGVSRYPVDGDSFDTLFSAADSAMYHAKNKKIDYFFYDNQLHEKNIETSKLDQALHSVKNLQQFYLMYQPQLDSHGKISGVEALCRWDSPELGFVPPDRFIPVAEDNGSIIRIGCFVIEQAFQDIAQLRERFALDLQLSVNVSVRQFQQQGFTELLKKVLHNYQFPAERLTLEITENIFIEEPEFMVPVFKAIRQLGIKISLDDFGTGYSSLCMLRKLPIDELKIDKSFINDVTENAEDKSMVLNILNIARNLGMQVVAEGIENEHQSKLLIDFGCEYQQGYYHSRPLKFQGLQEFCESYRYQ